jgi:Tol biopolymer transport system component
VGLFVVKSNDGQVRSITPDGMILNIGGDWSPDGKKIIFIAGSPVTGQNVYTANADGTGLSEVAADGDDHDPVWGTHPAVP